MPNFLYSIIAANLVTIGGMVYVIDNVRPNNKSSLGIFFFLLFVFCFLSISLLNFIIKRKKAQVKDDLRKIYRQGLGPSLILAACFTSLVVLRAYNRLTIMTGILLIAFLLSLLRASAVNRKYK